jgi:uncharacterized protein (DUF2267 family)
MDYDDFIATVQREAHLQHDDAMRAIRAALTTLAERLSGGEARDIAQELPPELRPLLKDGSRAHPFDLDEFLRRVAEREGVDETVAAGHARAVFAALGRAVSRQELEDMASELPDEFQPLVAAAESAPPPVEPRDVMPAETFVAKVSERAGLDPDRARRAAEAVLEALGERITRGQVEDLEEFLAPELHAPLDRGDARSDGAARPLSLEEFTELVAELEGVTPAEARDHARAVFATLREALPEKELSDTVAQLPRDFHAVLARP